MKYLDNSEQLIVEALQQSPRCSFTALADILGLSASTVSRKYNKLIEQRQIHVTSSLNWSFRGGSNPLILWVKCFPGKTDSVANYLSNLSETQTVFAITGAADIFCILRPSDRLTLQEIVLGKIPNIEGIKSVESNLILSTRIRSRGWKSTRQLSSQQINKLQSLESSVQAPSTHRISISEHSELVHALLNDGRAGITEISHALGITQVTAKRLLNEVLTSKNISPRVDVEPELLDYGLGIVLSIKARADSINPTLDFLSKHPAVRFAALTAGSSATAAIADFTQEKDLEHFITSDLASLSGISSFNVSLRVRTVKRNWKTINEDFTYKKISSELF